MTGRSYREVEKMETMYDVLDELKEEVSKLREECLAKTEVCESLRKGQIKQVEEIELSKLEIDKLALKLNAKSEEIYQIMRMHEELKSSSRRKELLLQQISLANEKLQGECSEKFLKLEAQNGDLVLSLEEASARIEDLKKESRANSEEISGLKMLLSKKTDQASELEKNAAKNLKERDEYMQKLEEEVRIARDQLKWKNEQFMHLEEAHGKLQAEFYGSKIEWEKEKSALIDEMSSLHSTFDAQIQVPESMENQLRIANQALAHEAGKRKALEIDLSQSRSQFEEVSQECQLAKSQIKQLALKRDEEIAKLWIIANKTKTFADEMRDENAEIKQDNSDLFVCFKDIQESQLNFNVKPCSSMKHQNKLETLEQFQSKCVMVLKDKEAEWNRQIETLGQQINYCVSQLGSKSKRIKELQKDLENHRCLLEVKDEENLTLITLLKSEIYVAHANFHDAKDTLETRIVDMEEKNMILSQKLHSNTTELHKVRTEMKKRHDEIVVLMERVESLDSLKQTHDVEKESYMRVSEERNCTIENLKYDIAQLKDKSAETEAMNAALSDAHNNLMLVHEGNLSNLKDKDQKMLEKVVILYETLMKAEAQKILEIEEKNQIICDLEKEVNSLHEGIESHAKLLAQSKQKAAELEASLETKNSEIQEVKSRFAVERSRTEDLVSHKQVMLDDLKRASSFRKDLVAQLDAISNQAEVLHLEDVELKGMLDKMLRLSEEEDQTARSQLSREKRNSTDFSSSTESFKASFDERTPLIELNFEFLHSIANIGLN